MVALGKIYDTFTLKFIAENWLFISIYYA